MNLYKLDDRTMDARFLQGETISCDAAMSIKELQEGKLSKGQRLVVMLSNGKKFMGIVEEFNYRLINGHASGTLAIRRSGKS